MKKGIIVLGIIVAVGMIAYGALAPLHLHFPTRTKDEKPSISMEVLSQPTDRPSPTKWLQLADVAKSDVVFFVDRSSIENNVQVSSRSNLTSIRGMRVKRQPSDGSNYDITTLYIDCATNQYAVGDELVYKRSTVVDRRDGLIKPFGPIPKNSAITQVRQYVCH